MAQDSFTLEDIKLYNQYRELGNQAFFKAEYYGALCNYNMALIATRRSDLKLLMSFAYGNRSAVYFEVKKYEQCLENIELAKTNGYPADKLQKLEAREKKCHEMIEQQQEQDPDDDPKDFFKLSYEANEKIPFIVNCLEIRGDGKRGRGIFTNQDLKAGDIIAIEEPFFAEIGSPHVQCATCMKQNMLNLIPGYIETMFCSSECYDKRERLIESYKISPTFPMFNSINKALSISRGYVQLREIYANPTKQTVFDFDLSNPNDPETKLNMLKCAVSLRQHQLNIGKTSDDMKSLVPVHAEFLRMVNLTGRQGKIITEILRRNVLLSRYSSQKLKENSYALTIFLSLVNHSCDSNIDIIHVYGHFVAIVNRPLRAGDQLLKSIGLTFELTSKSNRRQGVLEKLQYMCDCTACVEDYPLLMKLRHQDSRFKMPVNSFGTVKETTDELKKNWNYLSLRMKKRPTFETSTLLLRNRDLLDHLADLADCPFKKAKFRIFFMNSIG